MPASAAYQVLTVILPEPFSVRETPAPAPPRPRLLDRVRAALRARHYSRRTEEAYVAGDGPATAPSPARDRPSASC